MQRYAAETAKNWSQTVEILLWCKWQGSGWTDCPLEPIFDDKSLQKRAKIQNQAYVHRLYELCTRNRKSYLMIDSSAVEYWAHNLRV